MAGFLGGLGGGGAAGGGGGILGSKGGIGGMLGGVTGGLGINLSGIPFVGGMFGNPNEEAMQEAIRNNSADIEAYRPQMAQAYQNSLGAQLSNLQPAQQALMQMYGGTPGVPQGPSIQQPTPGLQGAPGGGGPGGASGLGGMLGGDIGMLGSGGAPGGGGGGDRDGGPLRGIADLLGGSEYGGTGPGLRPPGLGGAGGPIGGLPSIPGLGGGGSGPHGGLTLGGMGPIKGIPLGMLGGG